MTKPLTYIVLIGTPWLPQWEEPLARHLAFYQLSDEDYSISSINFVEWQNVEKRIHLIEEIKNSNAKRLHVIYCGDPENAAIASTIRLTRVIDDTWLYELYFDADIEGSEKAPGGWLIKKAQPRFRRIRSYKLQTEPHYLLINRAKEIAEILSRVSSIDQIWLYGSLARAHKQGYGSARDLDFALVTKHAEKWVEKPGGREDGPYRTIDYPYLHVWVPEVTKNMTFYISQLNMGQEFVTHPMLSELPPVISATMLPLMQSLGETSRIYTDCEFNLVPPNPTREWWEKFRRLGFDLYFPESMVVDSLRWDHKLQDFVIDNNFPGQEYLEEDLPKYQFIGGEQPIKPTEHYLAWERGDWNYKAYYNSNGELVPSWDKSLWRQR